jgi:hypothetical protein
MLADLFKTSTGIVYSHQQRGFLADKNPIGRPIILTNDEETFIRYYIEKVLQKNNLVSSSELIDEIDLRF